MTEISEGKDALLVDCGHFENLVAKGQGGRASNVAIIDGNYNECGSLREVAVDMASRVMEAAAGYSGISEGRTEKVGRGREQGIGAAQERIHAPCENKPGATSVGGHHRAQHVTSTSDPRHLAQAYGVVCIRHQSQSLPVTGHSLLSVHGDRR